MLSVIIDPALQYPAGDEFFSPSSRHPEYPFDHLAAKPNHVYEAVRRILVDSGLDQQHFGRRDWNPLGRYIKPGNRVFILCNFVYHRRSNETVEDFESKCTHGSVLRAIVDYAWIATGANGSIKFGNAPIQSSDFEQSLKDSGAATVRDFYGSHGVDVTSQDLRSFISGYDRLGRELWSRIDDTQKPINIDLGVNSLLSQIGINADNGAEFRSLDYDPRQMRKFHSINSHIYAVNQSILQSDVVISLPKLKTHEKVGITCAIKGFVGTVTHKECLAHHRFGDPKGGGDEFPIPSAVRLAMSKFNDYAQTRNREAPLRGLYLVIDRNLRRLVKATGAVQLGGWHGNDTCWRMAVDLARIAHYADKSGNLCHTRQRSNIALIDGIVGGEGEGPLSPKAIHAGALIFGDNVAQVDWASSKIMGFDPAAIALVEGAFHVMDFPLCIEKPLTFQANFNGRNISAGDLPLALGRPFLPPRGWREHLLKSMSSHNRER